MDTFLWDGWGRSIESLLKCVRIRRRLEECREDGLVICTGVSLFIPCDACMRTSRCCGLESIGSLRPVCCRRRMRSQTVIAWLLVQLSVVMSGALWRTRPS